MEALRNLMSNEAAHKRAAEEIDRSGEQKRHLGEEEEQEQVPIYCTGVGDRKTYYSPEADIGLLTQAVAKFENLDIKDIYSTSIEHAPAAARGVKTAVHANKERAKAERIAADIAAQKRVYEVKKAELEALSNNKKNFREDIKEQKEEELQIELEEALDTLDFYESEDYCPEEFQD